MMQTPSEPTAPEFSLLALVRMMRAAGSVLFTQSGLHGELARVEWAEEKNRLLSMLLALLFGMVFLIACLLCVSALVLALAWDTSYRIPALAFLVLVHGIGVGIAGWRFHLLAARSAQTFAATRTELAADIALLGRQP